MAKGFQVDISRFEKLLANAAGVSREVSAYALNRKAYFIARRALELTPRAKRADIEALGLRTVSARTRFSESRGRNLTVRKFEANNAALVDNYRRSLLFHGKRAKVMSYASRADMATDARKWVGKKLRSIGFLASGWVPALRSLSNKVPGGEFQPFKEDVNYRGTRQRKGWARPANPKSRNPVAIIANTISMDRYGNPIPEAPRAMMWRAVERAISEERGQTAKYLLEKLRQRFKNLF
jgi:hypothetical protein